MGEVLSDTSKSVKEGGITPLGKKRNASVFQQVTAFAKQYKIKLDKPIKELPKEQLGLLLFGDKKLVLYGEWM